MWNKWVLALIGVVGVVNIGIFLWIAPLADYDGEVTVYPKYRDALHVAMEIGRLDFISLLLTVLGILLATMALVGFGYVQYRAEGEAKVIADKVAREVAEKVATIHIKKLLGNLEGLDEVSGETNPIEAGNVDIIDVTEVERERGSNGNA